MPYLCKGVCKEFVSALPVSEKYLNGFKRCSVCNGFFQIHELRCPCCGVKLRTQPRHDSSKKVNYCSLPNFTPKLMQSKDS